MTQPSTRVGSRGRVCIVRQTDNYDFRREAEALVRAGFEVDGIMMTHPERARREVVGGVTLISLPAVRKRSSPLRHAFDYAWFFVLASVVLTARHLRRPYAVIQVTSMPDFLVLCAAVPKLLGARVVAFMNEPSPELAETVLGPGLVVSALSRIEQRVLRFADATITVTQQLKERYVSRGADPDRITVVLNGADPDISVAGWSPNGVEPDDTFTVMCHGLIEERYGQDTIIAAAALLKDELPDLRVVFTGRGSLADELETMIEAAGLEGVARYEGWVSRARLNDLLHTSQVGIVAQKASPYAHLVHTNKMVDYWIFGLPVIASRLRAVSETYDDATLEYYEPGDAADLARAIRRLHDDAQRRDELIWNGRAAFERNGWPVQRRAYVGVFERLLDENSTPSRRHVARPGSPRLDDLLRPASVGRLAPVATSGPPVFLEAGDWSVFASPSTGPESDGELIERFSLPDGTTLDAVRRDDGTVHVPFDLDEAYRNYIGERWRDGADANALSARQLDLYYRVKRLLPRSFWLQARRWFIAAGRRPDFPAWPLDDGVHRLLLFGAFCHLLESDEDRLQFDWFWPGSNRAAVILTHDVESAEGLRLALDLADLEETRGLRSSFNLVGKLYEIDDGIVGELEARGFEIGLHGLHHDRSLFSSRAEFERQLPELEAMARRLGAVGFRSPATHRVQDWLRELPVSYDCTVPHSDPYEPQPGGCCSLWPYMLGGDMVELPYTMPQDHTLFTLLRQRSAETWLGQLDAIERRFGLIQCLSHPDPGYLGDAEKRAIYAEFLDALADRDGLWKALPRDVAGWWRRRDAGETTFPEQRSGTVHRLAAPDYAWLEGPPVEEPAVQAANGLQAGLPIRPVAGRRDRGNHV